MCELLHSQDDNERFSITVTLSTSSVLSINIENMSTFYTQNQALYRTVLKQKKYVDL